jgi:hypothetical protein
MFSYIHEKLFLCMTLKQTSKQILPKIYLSIEECTVQYWQCVSYLSKLWTDILRIGLLCTLYNALISASFW